MLSREPKDRYVNFRAVKYPIEDWLPFTSSDGVSKLQTYRFPAK